jgi:type II secretory pathway component PulK
MIRADLPSNAPAQCARGSALLLVLWCVAVLSITVLAVARIVEADVGDASLENRRFEGRELALTGVAYGLNKKIQPWDPLLNEKLQDGRTLRVRIISEAARIDINRALKERNQDTLRKLFRVWEIPDEAVSVAIDSMKDWTDADNLRSLNGAEREDLIHQTKYSLPANRDFRSVSEMEKVRGMDVIAAYKPDWADFFTVYGGRKIDLQDAPIDILRAAGGLSHDQAEAVDQVRKGADRIAQTKDDYIIKSVPDFLQKVGLSQAQSQVMEANFSVNEGPTRIESTANVGGAKYKIVAIVPRSAMGGNEGTMYYWDEQ